MRNVARIAGRGGSIALLAVLVLFVLAAPGQAQRRVALVVGNGAYQAVPQLANPVPDAVAVARVLQAAGFQTDLVRDADRNALAAALRRFGTAAEGAELAVFYFAGHGIQIGGDNHLLPVDARLSHVRDVDYELVGLPLVLRAMQGAQARILFLDACRDNPLAAQVRGLSGTRSVGLGLARVETVDLGTLVAFSTSPGAVALDGTGANSPFTEALVRHMATPGLEVRQLMTRVRRSVVEATGGRQIPWDNSSLITEVVLRPGLVPAGGAQVAIAPVPEPSALRRPDPVAMPAPRPAAPAQLAAVQAVAREQGIPLPEDLVQVAAARGAHPLIGFWGGDPRWNRMGRNVMLLVLGVDAAGGTADIVFAGAAGAPRTAADGMRPRWGRYRANVSGSRLAWVDEEGNAYSARRTDFFGEVVEIVMTRSRTVGRTANPQGQVGIRRIE